MNARTRWLIVAGIWAWVYANTPRGERWHLTRLVILQFLGFILCGLISAATLFLITAPTAVFWAFAVLCYSMVIWQYLLRWVDRRWRVRRALRAEQQAQREEEERAKEEALREQIDRQRRITQWVK